MADDANENYYHVLNIPEDASLDDIKKAYRKLAVQFHPDKNPSPEAEEKFKMLSRAYNVLSNPDQRSRYDSERKFGTSGHFGGYRGRNSWSGFTEDPRETFRNLFSDYFSFPDFGNDDDFMSATREHFTKSSRFSEANNVRMHERSHERNSSQNCEVNHGGFSSTFNQPKKRKPTDFGFGTSGCASNDTSSSTKRPRTEANDSTNVPNMNTSLPKDPPIERPLEISLEELATGCTKKLKIKRTITSNTGTSRVDSNVIEIAIKPGWKAGTRITFQNVGDQNPGSIPADITFVLADKPHSLFTRDSNNNLLHTAKISLKNALLGVSYCIQGLNGKRHNVNVKDIIHPGYVKRYAGEGLPLPKTPSTRADLIVKFDIEFPQQLSYDQRCMLSQCLPE